MDLIWGESIVYHPKDNLGQKIKAVWDRRDDYTLDLGSMYTTSIASRTNETIQQNTTKGV